MLTATRSYQVDFVEAFDVMTGALHRFTVHHDKGRVLEIRYAEGYSVPKSSPQFTESAEAFHIDREYAEAVESDQPRLAALAGYQPRPIPSQRGIGYRRAA